MPTTTAGSPATPPSCGTGSPRWPRYADNRAGHRRARRGPRAHRRRRAPLPRRHLVALGHHPRPPRARARRGGPRPARPRRPHHAARQRQPRRRSSWPRRWPRSCPSTSRTSSSPPTAPPRWSRPSRSRSSTGPTRASPDRTAYLAFGGGVPRRHRRRALASATAASAPTCSTRSASRCCGRPRFDDPGCRRGRRGDARRARAHELAAVVVEPLVQGAAGMHLHDRRARSRRLADAAAAHDVLLVVRRGRHRLRPHRHAVRRPSSAGVRPDLLCIGKGLTGGYLPMAATVASAPRVRGLPRPRPRRADPLPRALLQRERPRGRRRAAPPRAVRRVGRARQRATPGPTQLGELLDDRVAALPGVARGAPPGPHDRRRAGAARRRPPLGPPGHAPRPSTAAC